MWIISIDFCVDILLLIGDMSP